MNLDKAKELGAKHMESADTLCVMSDGSVFINNNVDAMREHAKLSRKELFILKGEKKAEVKVEAKAEAPKEEKKASKKASKRK